MTKTKGTLLSISGNENGSQITAYAKAVTMIFDSACLNHIESKAIIEAMRGLTETGKQQVTVANSNFYGSQQ